MKNTCLFFRIFGLEFAPASQNNKLEPKALKLALTNETYPKAYYFEDHVNANSYGNNFLKSFYWDKKKRIN